MLGPSGRLTSGGDGEPTMDEMEEKKRIAEEEKKEKEPETIQIYTNTLPETNIKFAPENKPKRSKGNNSSIPTIHFQA